MQGGDRHVDFETLLVHAGQEVALHLKRHVWFENRKNISHVHLPHLLIIQFIETEKVVEADNLVVLIEIQLRSYNSDFSIPTFEKM